jgi:excisionase family DNA binding protein
MNNTARLPRMLTAREVNEGTGFPLWRIYEMGRNGELPAVRFGRSMRFPVDQLAERLRATEDGDEGR